MFEKVLLQISWQILLSLEMSKQALVRTLHTQVLLIRKLFNDGKVTQRKLQSDPLENRFSQYRQLSEGRS